jgi:putative tricarboxylic transport membrane protein
MAAVWKPDRKVQLVAGTPPGGGLDRVARALEAALVEGNLLDVPVETLNVPGDGARRAWTHCIDDHPGDGHMLGISSPNLTTDYLAGLAGFEHTRYAPISTLVTEYIAFATRADSAFASGADLIERLGRAPGDVTVALSTALGNPNHVALAKLTRSAGGAIDAPVVRVFDNALDSVADVVAGNADVCAVTAASVIAELDAGNLRMLGVSAPQRLGGRFADMPTWAELGADCTIGAWRGVTGPTGLTPEQAAFWQPVLRQAVEQPVWRDALAKMSWSPMYEDGTALTAFLADERAEYVRVLGELGLLKVAAGA